MPLVIHGRGSYQHLVSQGYIERMLTASTLTETGETGCTEDTAASLSLCKQEASALSFYLTRRLILAKTIESGLHRKHISEVLTVHIKL